MKYLKYYEHSIENYFDEKIKELLLNPDDEKILQLFFYTITQGFRWKNVKDNINILEKLMANFNINKFYPDYTGYDKTPLYIAIFHNYNLTKTLIKNNADINAIDNYGNTPLISLCSILSSNEEDTDRLKTIELLIKNNAKLDIQNKNGDTALISASKNVKEDRSKLPEIVIDLLIKSGASWNIVNAENKDFMDYLYKYQQNKIMRDYKKEASDYLIFKTAKKYNV